MPAILNGTVNPGKVFDRTIGLDEVPDAYRAMDDREALKVMIALQQAGGRGAVPFRTDEPRLQLSVPQYSYRKKDHHD